MKNFKILLLVAATTNILLAQDTIYTKNGTTIPAKVFEVTQHEVRYQKSSNLEGPIYTIDKSSVSLIEYKNGTKDVFSGNTSQSGNEPQAVSSGNLDDVYNQGQPQTVVNNYDYSSSGGYYNPGVSMNFMLGMPSLFWGVPYYAGPWGGWPYYRAYYRPYWAYNYYRPWGWNGYAWGGYGWGWRHNYHGNYGWGGGYHPGHFGGGYHGGYHGPRGGYGGGYHGGFGGGGGGFHH